MLLEGTVGHRANQICVQLGNIASPRRFVCGEQTRRPVRQALRRLWARSICRWLQSPPRALAALARSRADGGQTRQDAPFVKIGQTDRGICSDELVFRADRVLQYVAGVVLRQYGFQPGVTPARRGRADGLASSRRRFDPLGPLAGGQRFFHIGFLAGPSGRMLLFAAIEGGSLALWQRRQNSATKRRSRRWDRAKDYTRRSPRRRAGKRLETR